MLCRHWPRATKAARVGRGQPRVLLRACIDTAPRTTTANLLATQPINTARLAASHRFPSSLTLRSYSTSTPETAPTAPEKPDFLSEAEAVIWDRLMAEFAPTELVVQDISGGCGSMYGIEICSAKFSGANMLKQQRMVNAVLGDLMKGWHGVQLKTRQP